MSVIQMWVLLAAFALSTGCKVTNNQNSGVLETKPKTSTDRTTPFKSSNPIYEQWITEWNEPHRKDWYLLTQGSHLLPFDVFMSLFIEINGQPVRFYKLLQKVDNKYGFIYPQHPEVLKKFTQNIDNTADGQKQFALGGVKKYFKGGAGGSAAPTKFGRLPIGVMADNDKEGTVHMGFTCATCHTGEVMVGKTQYLIDAGVPFLSFNLFLDDLKKALEDSKSKYYKMYMDAYINVPALWRHPDAPAGQTMLQKEATIFNPKTTSTYFSWFGGTIQKRLDEALAKVSGYHARNVEGAHPPHPGRLDALTAIMNEVLGDDLGENKNLRRSMSPVSIPYVWDAPKLECVQTNCLSTSPLSRNIGEVLGVFGSVNLDLVIWRDLSKSGLVPDLFEDQLLETSAKVENLVKMEDSLKTLYSPSWPQELSAFGAIDKTLWTKGKNLYMQNCAGCHALVEKDNSGKYMFNEHNQYSDRKAKAQGMNTPDDVKFMRVTVVPYKEIGTDPNFIEYHSQRTAIAGESFDKLLAGAEAKKPANNLISQIRWNAHQNPQNANGIFLLGITTEMLAAKYLFETNKISPQSQGHVKNWRSSKDSTAELGGAQYRARPHNGIVFTGPFLHNGSVPNIAQMLTPPQQRVKHFWVGNRTFDRQNLGYTSDRRTDSRAEMFHVVDQNGNIIPGNSNLGHDHGTGLEPKEKRALMEFIKSL